VPTNLFGCRPYAILLAIFFMLATIAFKPWVHGIDGAGYYSWLRSWVIQGDCNTEDEMNHFHLLQPADLQFNVWSVNFSRLKNGQLANYYPIGSAVLWAPFFLTAHIGVMLANACGSRVSADGYSTPYILLSMLGSAIWAFAGLSLIYHIVAKQFGQIAGALATGTVWLSTPLVFYMYAHPAMSHANDVFVNSLFIFVWLATRRDRTWRGWLLLGLATGLAAMVRTQNGLLVVFPCVELLLLVVASLRQRIGTSLWKTVGWASTFIGGALAAFLPQMLVWKTVFGSYLVLNPQQASLGLGFDFTGRHVLNVLFSTNRGLFLWSPVTILALAGIMLLFRSDRRLAALLLCNFALQLYVVGSWVIWSGGISFGPRFFLNSVPAFAIGLAVVLSELRKRVPRSVAAALCGAFVLWNFGLMVQYVLQLVPRAGEVPLRQMVFNQFAVVPGKIIDLILRAASRS
jgi:hypothetical protein